MSFVPLRTRYLEWCMNAMLIQFYAKRVKDYSSIIPFTLFSCTVSTSGLYIMAFTFHVAPGAND